MDREVRNGMEREVRDSMEREVRDRMEREAGDRMEREACVLPLAGHTYCCLVRSRARVEAE